MYIQKNKKTKVWLCVLFFCMSLVFTEKVLAQEDGLENKDLRKADKMMEVNLYKKDQIYSVESIRIINAEGYYLASYESVKGKIHDGVVMSFKGKALGYFQATEMNITMCWDSFNQSSGESSGGCEELPEGGIRLLLPYFPNGKYTDIYNPQGEKILTIDLSSKATCNENEVCNGPIEDSINCPSDCGIQKEAAAPKEQKPSQYSANQEDNSSTNAVTPEKKKGVGTVLLVFLIVLLMIAVVIILLIWRKKKMEEEDD